MKTNVIQVIDITGSPIACYQLDSLEDLIHLYKGQLFQICQLGLTEYGQRVVTQSEVNEKNRFVVGKDTQERQILSKVEPIQCFLHYNDINSKKININPYQSVRWLKNLVESQISSPVRLTVNNHDLSEENNSLMRYIYENAIIHVNQMVPGENILSQMKVKEPGTQSMVYNIQNISTSLNVDQLVRIVSEVTGIPYQFLHLVYGGKILSKDKIISQYHVQAKGFLYAVDSRKYMKKVTMSQYQKRQSEIKQMKENNKAIIHKLKQQIQKQKVLKDSPNKKVYTSPKNTQTNTNEENHSFRKPMSIQSSEYEEFKSKFQKSQSQSQPQLQKLNSQLKHGRIVTKEEQVYQDEEGFIHEHTKQKSLYRNGQKIVNYDITEDQQGNIIQIEKDTVNIRRDSKTGEITKQQTDIIENLDNTKIIIKKQEVRDKQGHLIKFGTSRITQNSNQEIVSGSAVAHRVYEPVKSQHKEISIDSKGNIHTSQKQIIQQENRTTFVDKNTLQDSQGHIIIKKTNITEIQNDEQGNVQKHKSELVERNGRLRLVETDEIIDSDGTIIRKQKDTLQISDREDGTFQKKQMDVIEQDGNTKIIKKGVIQDEHGNIIKSQTKVIDITGSDYNINVHERQQLVEAIKDGQEVEEGQIEKQVKIIHDQYGNTITVEKQSKEDGSGHASITDRYKVQNSQGQVIREQTQTIQLNEDSQIPQVQRYRTDYTETENKAVLIEKLTTQNVDGSIIRSENQTVEVQQLLDGSIHKTETEVVTQHGKKTIHVKDEFQDQTGKLISKTSEVMEVSQAAQNDQGYRKSVEISTTNRRYDYDADGNICITQTKVGPETENEQLLREQTNIFMRNSEKKIVENLTQENNQNDIKNINTQQKVGQLAKKIARAQLYGEVTQLQKNITVDEEGNSHIIEKQVILDHGKRIQVDTQTIKSPGGEILHSVTDIIEQKLQDGNLNVYKTEITQNEGQIKVTQTVISKEGGYTLINKQWEEVGGDQLELPKRMEIKQTQSITNSELLYEMSSPHKIDSQNFIGMTEEANQLPQQYTIFAVNKQSDQVALLIRYDDIIDEIAQKLAEIIQRPKQSIKFYKDGVELAETECAVELEIYPGSMLYYVDDQ